MRADLGIRKKLFGLGVAITSIVALATSLDLHYGGASRWWLIPEEFRLSVLLAAHASFLVVLGVLLLRTADTRQRLSLLSGLLVLALVLEDLSYLVAILAPLHLSRTAARRWLGVQLVFGASTQVVFNLGELRADPSLTWLLVSAAIVPHAAWQSLGFALGWMMERVNEGKEKLALRNQQLKDALGELATQTRLAERLALSRELHDTVGHHVAALGVNLALAQRICGDAQTQEVLADARTSTQNLLDEIRDVVGRLRHPLPIALSRALQAFAATAAVPVKLTVAGEVLDGAAAHALYRCTQEATTNAIRHGSASSLSVVVEDVDGGVRLSIHDDGPGNLGYRRGNGLEGMEERIRALGGRVHIDGGPGFPINVWLPVISTRATERAH